MVHNLGAPKEALKSKFGTRVATPVAEPRAAASTRVLAFPSRGGSEALPWFKSRPDLEF